jgi:hypothetical protein
MVKVSVEIRNGAARFGVAVQAESIRRAVSLAGDRYPGRDVRVKFPTDPEGSFVEGPAARARIAEEFEQPTKQTAA